MWPWYFSIGKPHPPFFFPYDLDKEISDEEESGDGDSEGLGLEESEEEEEEEELSATEEEDADNDLKISLAQKNGRGHSAEMPGFSFQGISDFEKFAEGMDDLGSSEAEEESGMEEGDVEENLEGESEEDREGDRNSEDDGVVMTFSSVKVSEEVEKGRAVKNQIGVCVLLLLACFFYSFYINLLFDFGCYVSPAPLLISLWHTSLYPEACTLVLVLLLSRLCSNLGEDWRGACSLLLSCIRVSSLTASISIKRGSLFSRMENASMAWTS